MPSFSFNNKVILIFSSQEWGEMHLSKHHYAIALAKKGNEVFFINPPSDKHQKVQIREHSKYKNLFIVSSGVWNVHKFRFHFHFGFRIITKWNNQRIKKRINKKIDVVWNFDFLGLCHYSVFNETIKIAHPVDFTKSKNLVHAKGADFLFSVAHEIIEEFSAFNVPSFFVNHSISEQFLTDFPPQTKDSNETIKVGYVGNLLRHDIDYEIIISLIETNTDVEFVFIGNYEPANLGGVHTPATRSFVQQLKEASNVTLQGVLNPNELPEAMSEMDLFLIAYDKEKDFCRGTNYHKVMEYLSTGKTIVSNHITTYSKLDMLQMPEKDHSNKEMINIFEQVVNNIDVYNSKKEMDKRISFARQNTYNQNIEKIERIINQQN